MISVLTPTDSIRDTLFYIQIAMRYQIYVLRFLISCMRKAWDLIGSILIAIKDTIIRRILIFRLIHLRFSSSISSFSIAKQSELEINSSPLG